MKTEKASIAKKFRILGSLLLVLLLTVGFYISQGTNVLLSVDGELSEVSSRSRTVEDFLEKEGVIVKEGAYINLPLESKLEKDLEIVIINPKPYTIKANNTLLEIESIHDNVDDILREQEIVLGEFDYVKPELSSKVNSMAVIEIFRVHSQLASEEESIPFGEEARENPNLYKGTKKIVQKGKDGIKLVHRMDKYINGKLDSSSMDGEEVLKEAQVQIVEVGSKERIIATSRGSTRFKKHYTMTATAYTDDKASQGKWVGKTATGMKPQVGVVAVDPRVIPLRSQLYIEGYGFAIAGDTGGSIKGNRIDLFKETRTEAYKFGRRKVNVYVLE